MATTTLIIGGAGFVGSQLVRRCVDGGEQVHVVLRPSTDAGRLTGVLPAANVHRLSLSDREAVWNCLEDVQPTHIFHVVGNTGSRHDASLGAAQASIDGLRDLMSLIEATAALSVPPSMFIRTGSIAEYGAGPVPFRETQREYPSTGYAAAMVAGTHYAQTVADALPFPLVTARLSLVYGPGQARDFLVPSLISSKMEGRPLVINRALDRRDLIHVEDAADALWALARSSVKCGEIVNIGSNASITVAELAGLVARLAGERPAIVPGKQAYEPVTLQLSVDRLRSLIGPRPQIPIIEGLAALMGNTCHVRAGAMA